MYRKQDFKKLDLLGSGKKYTKIFKVQHIQTGKIYALKEIEAKTLEKLNEYKEEAVQLSKVQNQMIYRQKKKQNIYWKESELLIIMFSLISTCSLLQQKGICHRDIKPANIFLMENGEIKLIDFGESKDYFYDPQNVSKNTYTMATIRGTPQYLSPIQWKAHVIDGNSRYVEHNIYKSDVYSSGLVIYQLAAIEEVTGFNNKTSELDGEQLTKNSLQELEKKYSNQFVNIIALMLIFEESARPSFVEIEQLFIEHENQYKESIDSKNDGKKKKLNKYIRMYNQQYNSLLQNKNSNNNYIKTGKNSLQQSQMQTQNISIQLNNQQQQNNLQQSQYNNIQNNQIQLNREIKNKENQEQFYKESTLILNENCYWFEFGGNSIGKFSLHKQKWKITQNPDQNPFPYHFTVVYIPESKYYYLLGGLQGNNFRIFTQGKIIMAKNQISTEKNFVAAVYYNNKVWIFGGYDSLGKSQLNQCEFYNIQTEKWQKIADLVISRSQAAACRINDNEILVLGGYNKDKGTLDNIERYIINENRFELTNIKIPIPLRRFMVVRVANNQALILGGLSKFSKESQRVFKLDYEKQNIIELEQLEKGGIIENKVLVDNQDIMHIFLENANGTSPHSHIKYYYDPKYTMYVTQQEI
ncbi:protein kinase domain protein [Ichthyophthirius multifiliis]|uniref:Protein kinase domain protein n=1 Tax=Ichthyophthirius multifiliis TaxID=5932 RepID=G0QMD5_ICHMU|nr:protein kinase domain protein [Ichthyophthirius multifiliis]EGR33629.1 protein kinase domain protein [Ichthyophthirius multifiliis]|eukprot:XP_004037615.1 protein kinase domain protein [Ichthyophthirius multifiliis]